MRTEGNSLGTVSMDIADGLEKRGGVTRVVGGGGWGWGNRRQKENDY